jgi:hypothetical protein
MIVVVQHRAVERSGAVRRGRRDVHGERGRVGEGVAPADVVCVFEVVDERVEVGEGEAAAGEVGALGDGQNWEHTMRETYKVVEGHGGGMQRAGMWP